MVILKLKVMAVIVQSYSLAPALDPMLVIRPLTTVLDAQANSMELIVFILSSLELAVPIPKSFAFSFSVYVVVNKRNIWPRL